MASAKVRLVEIRSCSRSTLRDSPGSVSACTRERIADL